MTNNETAQKQKDEDELLEELADEFLDDPEGVLEKLDECGYGVDDLPL